MKIKMEYIKILHVTGLHMPARSSVHIQFVKNTFERVDVGLAWLQFITNALGGATYAVMVI